MCSDLNYTHWKAEYQSVLESFCDKNIIMLFSGGKDSSVAMDLIHRASQEFGFDFTAHAGTFPVHRYTINEKKRIESYWIKQGVSIIWHDMGKTDDDLENSENPCLLCQRRRKELLESVLTRSIKNWNRLVLIVGFSLWDIVSYSIEHLLSDVFSNPDQGMGVEDNKRFKETAQRFYPLLTMEDGYQVFRPLIKYNDDDILKVITRKNIPILSIPCKFKDLRPKMILEKYYNRMDMRFNYNQLIDFAIKSLNLPDVSICTSIEKENYLLNVF
jgi:tRNA(Ile)-lysidine synthase TilS/MesJ